MMPTTRKQSADDLNWRLVAPLILLFVIGCAGFVAPAWAPTFAEIAKNGVNQEWLGFIGSIIGALISAGAALVAWFAVQHQIKAQRDLFSAPSIIAWEEFRGILNLLLYDVNGIWRALELATESELDSKILDHRLEYVESFFDDLASDGLLADLRAASEKIDRLRYRRARYLLKEITSLSEKIDSFKKSADEDKREISLLKSLLATCQHIAAWVNFLDPSLNDHFADRQGRSVIWGPDAILFFKHARFLAKEKSLSGGDHQ